MNIILKDSLKEFIISDNIFNYKFNPNLIHQVFVSYLSNIRQNSKMNKNRSNVSGSGKKPWKQKGTGKSRSGCIRSPIWRSGGVTFGSQKKVYYKKINKKMYKIACKSLLSKLIKENRILIFDYFNIDTIKTKILYNIIYKYCKNDSTLILTDKYYEKLFKSANNIFFLKIKIIFNINLISIINFNFIIIDKKNIRILENLLS